MSQGSSIIDWLATGLVFCIVKWGFLMPKLLCSSGGHTLPIRRNAYLRSLSSSNETTPYVMIETVVTHFQTPSNAESFQESVDLLISNSVVYLVYNA